MQSASESISSRSHTNEWGITYDKVANEDLKDLGLQAGPSCEHSLEYTNKDVTERRTDQGAVRSHLGHARSEVVTILVAVLCYP